MCVRAKHYCVSHGERQYVGNDVVLSVRVEQGMEKLKVLSVIDTTPSSPTQSFAGLRTIYRVFHARTIATPCFCFDIGQPSVLDKRPVQVRASREARPAVIEYPTSRGAFHVVCFSYDICVAAGHPDAFQSCVSIFSPQVLSSYMAATSPSVAI